MDSITGIVVEMDISHMRAAVSLNGGEDVVDAKVGKIYEMGDEIVISDVHNINKPWYLQGEEWMDENPICEAEVLRGWSL